MSRVYMPSAGPSAWQAFLAEPEKHWRTGYSARTLAYSWEASDSLPAEISAMFDEPAELLIAIPEHKVHLDGGTRPSQSDVFALIRFGTSTCAAAIEGKVNEPFGPLVSEWLRNASERKMERLKQLCSILGLDMKDVQSIRYQLLHRTASALIEATRFKTDEAAMIVHSFSPTQMWFADFARFAGLLGASAVSDRPSVVSTKSCKTLRLGWATGNPSFLKS